MIGKQMWEQMNNLNTIPGLNQEEVDWVIFYYRTETIEYKTIKRRAIAYAAIIVKQSPNQKIGKIYSLEMYVKPEYENDEIKKRLFMRIVNFMYVKRSAISKLYTLRKKNTPIKVLQSYGFERDWANGITDLWFVKLGNPYENIKLNYKIPNKNYSPDVLRG